MIVLLRPKWPKRETLGSSRLSASGPVRSLGLDNRNRRSQLALQPGIDGLSLHRQYAKHTLMHPRQRRMLHEAVQPLQP